MKPEIKSAHTPGPWGIAKEYHQVGGYIIDKNNVAIASLTSHSKYPKEIMMANARLIAAAPELLMAAQHFRSCVHHDPQNFKDCMKAETVIVKAEGE